MDITTAPEEVTISRKKLYCFARMYQALETTGNPFMGCQYCRISKYGNECPFAYKDLKKYTSNLTGVGLHILKSVNDDLEKEYAIH